MARYLLVEIDDNPTANTLRAQIDSAEAAGKGLRVVGMFSKPTALCSCPTRTNRSVKGAKFGWWLCPECRRPKSGVEQTLWNMLDDNGTPAKYLELHIGVRWYKTQDDGVKTARSLPEEQWR